MKHSRGVPESVLGLSAYLNNLLYKGFAKLRVPKWKIAEIRLTFFSVAPCEPFEPSRVPRTCSVKTRHDV